MNDEDTERAVLKYLQTDNDDEYGPLRSLTTIFEKVMRPTAAHADDYDEDDEIHTKEELRALLDRMAMDGLLQSQWGDRNYEASYKLTEEGNYEASGFEPLAVLDQPLEGEIEAPQNDNDFDSSRWTGLPSQFTLTAQKQATLLRLLDEAERNLEAFGATNAEKSMARAYIVAARALADAPDPQTDIIWELISRASNLAGVASLFVAIIALFIAAK